jgi:TonB family protein
MEAFGMYLVKSAVWLTGFTLIYLVFLRNERYFGLNRTFLLSGIFASILFPLFTWHYAVVLPPMPVEEISVPEEVQVVTYVAPAAPKVPFYWWIYILGFACLALRLILQTIKVVRRLRKAGYEKNGPIKLVRTPEYSASFSFFSFVFVNPSTSDIEAQEIMNHESGHIQNRHWFDLLLMEFLRILQWFNPFVWIYARLVRQNHEYLADEIALQRTSDPAVYQAALLNQVFGVPVISLANSFSSSLNNKRFAMMKKKIHSPFRKLKLLMALPLIALVFYAFAKPEYVESKTNTDNISVVSKEGKVKGTVTNEKGNPLEGVAIIVQGTTTGTNTDANGDFVLKNVPSDAELVFSYIGLKSERLKPDFDHRMMVKMEISIVGVQPVNVGEDPNNYLSEGFQKDGNKTAFKGPKDQFVVVEQMPQYPGGYKAMMHFLLENVKYPPEAKAAGKEGTVVVNFLVNKRGKIKEIKTIQSVDPALDAEAVRVVNSMPDWDPGEQNGKPVDVYYSIPIQFSLKEKKSIDNAKQPGIILKDIEIPKEDPLYIIDGVIVSKDIFKKLDPATIKSVSILKNESATAPYGEKGKNGVILISTKVNLGTPQSSNSLSDIKVIGYGYGQQLQ